MLGAELNKNATSIFTMKIENKTLLIGASSEIIERVKAIKDAGVDELMPQHSIYNCEDAWVRDSMQRVIEQIVPEL
jgi:hypothetical protein